MIIKLKLLGSDGLGRRRCRLLCYSSNEGVHIYGISGDEQNYEMNTIILYFKCLEIMENNKIFI